MGTTYCQGTCINATPICASARDCPKNFPGPLDGCSLTKEAQWAPWLNECTYEH
jgi:hypothetical protein